MGVFLFSKGGDRWFSHNGGNEAFLCTSYGSMANGNGAVVMINGDNFAIISEIINSIAAVYGWKDFYKPTFKKLITVSRDTLQTYTGSYLAGKDTLTVTFCGDQLCISQNNQPPGGYKLIFTAIAEASVKEVPDVTIGFLHNELGKVDVLEVNGNGGKTKFVRMK